MSTSNEMNIYQKLVEVRREVEYLQKKESGQQYSYVSSSQVLAALREKLNELNMLLIPKIINKNVREDTVSYEQNGRPKNTTTYFTELDLEYTWVNADKPDETIVCPWYEQGVDIAGEKGVGKALTYAEKYFMLKFFNIPTDKDDPDAFQQKQDSNAEVKPVKKTFNNNQSKSRNNNNGGSNGRASEKQMKMIHAKIAHISVLTKTEKQTIEDTLKGNIGTDNLSEISSQIASKAIEVLMGWEKQYSQAG
ncbi:ERF family protein [Bacillus wiedmannii]|uniref:ERF family protein n=1 Tax=Bacillus wiedmannii TaxID=1890302 RepID=UPI0020D24397|nr:ERF family protein [Bacillus wiedmannii]